MPIHTALSALLCLALSLPAFAAGDMIEIGGPAGARVSIDAVLGSPVMRARQAEVLARAEAKVRQADFLDGGMKDLIAGAIEELPFHRIIDLELVIPGFPDGVGLCLEGHPTNQLAIEACATTVLLISSLTAGIAYRWDLVLHRTASGKIHQLALGPQFGVRRIDGICFDSCPDAQWYVEAKASLEYVFWITRHFGLTAQLDLGGMAFVGYEGQTAHTAEFFGNRFLPTGKFSIGVAF